jgi:small subunit ribosomal protein S11
MAESSKPAGAPKAEKAPKTPKAEKPAAAGEAPKPAKAPKKKEDKAPAPAATPPSAAVEAAVTPLDPLSLDPNQVEKPKIVKAKGSKNVIQGIAHVLATFNNTIVSITDLNGNVIGWSSAGKCGFRGSKKATAYVAQVVAQDASRQAMGHGLKEVAVRVRGPGTGRESAVRALQAIGLEVTSITDVTPVPHNGCRPRKQRRV